MDVVHRRRDVAGAPAIAAATAATAATAAGLAGGACALLAFTLLTFFTLFLFALRARRYRGVATGYHVFTGCLLAFAGRGRRAAATASPASAIPSVAGRLGAGLGLRGLDDHRDQLGFGGSPSLFVDDRAQAM
jgi:hypothetical protein